MATKTARPFIEKPKKWGFNGLGESHPHPPNNRICSFWLAGKCNRNPCRFLHLDSSDPRQNQEQHIQPKRKLSTWTNPKLTSSEIAKPKKFKSTWINPNLTSSKIATTSPTEGVNSEAKTVEGIKKQENVCEKDQKKLCQYWVTDRCVYGNDCKDQHSWFTGSGFSLLAKLERRHQKAVTGVSLPSGHDKLFSGSKDESLCIWDCNSGQCVNTVQLGSEIGCLISEDPWVFVGLKNCVKAFNINTQTELLLSGPNGLVHSIEMFSDDDTIFGGVEDGSIVVWKATQESNHHPVVVATLTGHKLAVLCLAVGVDWLYSGSMDGTIRVWSVKTLECLHVLNSHSGPVTSLLCWDKYLLSGSLDNTLKMWVLTEDDEKLEVVNEVREESGIVALSGICDSEDKPILLCSRTDDTVRLYNLPSFTEKGRIFSKGVVESIAVGRSREKDLFFTGDSTGELFVWKVIGGQPKEEEEGTQSS